MLSRTWTRALTFFFWIVCQVARQTAARNIQMAFRQYRVVKGEERRRINATLNEVLCVCVCVCVRARGAESMPRSTRFDL
jgi:hypothetical protein